MSEKSPLIHIYRNSNEVVNAIAFGYMPELVELISTGYGNEVAYSEKIERTLSEYNYPNRAIIALCKDAATKECIGSLTGILWKNSEFDKRGKLVRRFFSSHGISLSDENCGMDVGGIVVAPRFRGRGIGQTLMRAMVQEAKPVIVAGQTKNPTAIKARLHALSDDYVLVYGGKVISEHALPNAIDVARFATELFFYTKEIPHSSEIPQEFVQMTPRIYRGPFHVSERDLIPSTLVDLRSVPENTYEIFAQINQIQDELDRNEIPLIAWSPLVAIRKDICSLIPSEKQNVYRE